jgi:hypothetical protein
MQHPIFHLQLISIEKRYTGKAINELTRSFPKSGLGSGKAGIAC